MCSIGIETTPGFKMCPSCRKEVLKKLDDWSALQNNKDEDDFQEQTFLDDIADIKVAQEKEIINTSFDKLDVSPVKFHGIPQHAKISLGKRKLVEATNVMSKKLSVILNVNATDLKNNVTEEPNVEHQRKADDLDKLIVLMQEKLKTSNRREKIQILTLVPDSWSLRKAAEEFITSKSTITKARKLKFEKGILALPEKTSIVRINSDIINQVESFYCNDQFSRQLPGIKDFVSISKNKHVSKRLLLCNLKELFVEFKLEHPQSKKGFSKFAQLKPKWCIYAGQKGTHAVCICTIHQNVKLMLSAVKLEKNYHELIEKIVCSRESRECMVHRCNCCPGIQNVINYINANLLQNEGSIEADDKVEEDETIEYKQWSTTDRAELLSYISAVDKFIESLCEKLDSITSHSFIAKAQGKYLSTLKSSIPPNEVIVLVDFAENFKFVIQDEIQSYHWNQQQCTLHPVVIYNKYDPDATKSQPMSLCFISDDLTHDVGFIYCVIKRTVIFVQEMFPKAKNIHYFSDGCAGQYKNCKHFSNLCHHAEYFGMQCEWNFFATSHGKSPCDGIGGTVKRLVSSASLQRPIDLQILTAEEMFNFSKDNIFGIHFLFLKSEDIFSVRKSLTPQLNNAKTLPGTRSFHQFIPQDATNINVKRVSEQEEFNLTFNLTGSIQYLQEIIAGKYYICKYDMLNCVGLVSEVDEENEDKIYASSFT